MVEVKLNDKGCLTPTDCGGGCVGMVSGCTVSEVGSHRISHSCEMKMLPFNLSQTKEKSERIWLLFNKRGMPFVEGV